MLMNFPNKLSSSDVGVDLQITMKSGNEKKKSTHCRIHSKIQTKHRRKKEANSIPFNTQIHANSSEDTTITLQYCITLHYERWLYDQKL